MALLSILGMYNYDSSVMEGFNVPENVDRDTAVNSILLECAELELIYSNIEIMKLAIATWSDKELPIWTRLQKTNEFEYNPIYNLDVTETTTEQDTDRDTETRNLETTTSNNVSSSSEYEDSGDASNVHSVHGFNQTTWAESEKDDNNTESSGSTTNSASSTGSNSDSGTVIHDGEHSFTREYKRAGNQGVTSTQQMIKEEREISSFNIIDYIVKSFKRRFCLGVY